MCERAVHDYGIVLGEYWFVTRALKRHFPYNVVQMKNSRQDLVNAGLVTE
jgi:hypothetical protein